MPLGTVQQVPQEDLGSVKFEGRRKASRLEAGAVS